MPFESYLYAWFWQIVFWLSPLFLLAFAIDRLKDKLKKKREKDKGAT